MLEIFPVKDTDKLNKLFSDVNLTVPEGAAAYTATEGGREVGFCLFSVAKDMTGIIRLHPLDDMFLCDSFIRAVINYSGNRAVFRVICENDDVKHVVNELEYLKDGESEIDIMSMMNGCNGCKKCKNI